MCTRPDDVNASQRARIEALLLRHANLFARHEYDVGGTSLIKYRLELKDPNSQPVREPLRQHPVAYLDLIDREIDRLLSAGLIEMCNSTYASNVVLVKRKVSPDAPPGTAPRLRITVDYRALNSKLKRLSYPMPSASLILDSLQGHHRFTTLDFSNAYLSVKLDEETNYLAAFITRRGMFTFRRLGAGLASAPAIFNQLIQSYFLICCGLMYLLSSTI